MSKKLAMALVPLLMAGCGDDLVDENKDGIADGINRPGSVTVVAPASPTGTVAGQVLSSRYLPLEGVEVAMTIGGALQGAKATTDATGSFAIKDVPAGSRVLLTFSKPGFVTARATSIIPSEAGNVPINNGNANFGPVMMAETNGTVKFQVYTPSARPATGAKATLVVDQAAYLLSNSAETLDSRVVVQGEVDSQGILSFSGVPTAEEGARLNSNYTLYISSMDTDNDGLPDVDGEVREYRGSDLLTGGNSGIYEALTIQLSPAIPSAALSIKYANLGMLRTGASAPLNNMVRSGEPISIAFNKPVQASSLIVKMTDEYGREALNVTHPLTASNTYLSITPGATLVAGKEYNLYLRAVAVSDGSIVERTVAFIAGDPANPPASVVVESARFADSVNNGQFDYGERMYLNLNQVIGFVGIRTAQAFFRFDLNNSGTIGDALGEHGNANGFPVTIAEPAEPNPLRPQDNPVSPLAASTGYSTRLQFVYTGGAGAYPFFSPNNLPEITLKFADLVPGAPQYQTGWGVPLMTDLIMPSPVSASTYVP